MSDGVVYIISVTLLIALAGLAFWIMRQSLGAGGVMLFQPKQRRLGLVESTSVDGRRRLLLVRRDDVEHLILTGGPVDVLLETGIQSRLGSLNGLGEAIARADNELDNGRAFPAVDDRLSLQHDQST
jgi:Flagellar biosynthesis protein, FliO